MGGLDGTVHNITANQGFHVVQERQCLQGLWNAYKITLLDDGEIDGGGGFAEVYENQRRKLIGGDFKCKNLFSTDRSAWSDEGGQKVYDAGLEDAKLLPTGADWTAGSAWCDEPWEHAFNFTSKWTVRQTPAFILVVASSLPARRLLIHLHCDNVFQAKRASTDYVRRRKWRRQFRMRETALQPEPEHGDSLPLREELAQSHIDILQKRLKKATRSCLVMVDNLSPFELRLEKTNLDAGTWEPGYEPPSQIR